MRSCVLRVCSQSVLCICVCVFSNEQCVVRLSSVEVTVSGAAGSILQTGRQRKRAPRPEKPRLVCRPKLCKYTLLTHNSYITRQESLQTVFIGRCQMENVMTCLVLCRAKRIRTRNAEELLQVRTVM